ncbi:hypothetical protein F4604DRAFT_1906213 [Suillus subluteus]|nr:hypothetical protein F4604DRAFT_1906213 [Suillus subluteus]
MEWVVRPHVGALVILKNGKQVVSAEGEFPAGVVEDASESDEDDFDENDRLDWQLWAARGKHSIKRLLVSEIPGQRQSKPTTYQRFDTSRGWDTYSASPLAHAERPSSSRLLDLKTFFDGIRPSSDKKGKQKERRTKRDAPKVVDVPLGIATPGDVVGVDDGIRPYVLFFCLSWFQKKKKLDPPRPVYDDELDDDESEHVIIDIPISTTRTQIETDKKTKLTLMSFFPVTARGRTMSPCTCS